MILADHGGGEDMSVSTVTHHTFFNTCILINQLFHGVAREGAFIMCKGRLHLIHTNGRGVGGFVFLVRVGNLLRALLCLLKA